MFAAASAAAALIAASAVARHQESVDAGAALRPVLVAAQPIDAGARIEAVDVEVRRFPGDYVPAEGLDDPAGAIGARSSVQVPTGAYLMPSLLGGVRHPPGGPVARSGARRADTGRARRRRGGRSSPVDWPQGRCARYERFRLAGSVAGPGPRSGRPSLSGWIAAPARFVECDASGRPFRRVAVGRGRYICP